MFLVLQRCLLTHDINLCQSCSSNNPVTTCEIFTFVVDVYFLAFHLLQKHDIWTTYLDFSKNIDTHNKTSCGYKLFKYIPLFGTRKIQCLKS